MENETRPYYKAYEERYKTIHAMGYGWSGDNATPLVAEVIGEFRIEASVPMLEIGCGEGRDALPLLKRGYDLIASDVSDEAISYCRKKAPQFADRFRVMDCLDSRDRSRYGFIYAVAVVHMLLLDDDRDGFYRFIRGHLTNDGIALICSMGDGVSESATDLREAFVPQERNHPAGKVKVAGTSFRKVSFPHFEDEIARNGLRIVKKGIAPCPPEFNELMYAVVRVAPLQGAGPGLRIDARG